ncbi:MAG: MFS transporter [Elusimicrobiota bacterium]|nr:MAG: MFS transporter [Elusimicrobiota bacterium]
MESWRALRRLPRRVWILSAAAMINRAGTMALPFLTLYLTGALGFTPARAGAYLGLYGAVSLLVAPAAGYLCDAWGTRRMMLVTLSISGASMLAVPAARGPVAVAAAIVVWAAATEAFRPAVMTAVSESAPADMRQQAYALNRLAVNVGMSLGPALGGWLATVSYPAIWYVDAATSLAAAAVLAVSLPPAPPVPAAREGGPSARGLLDPRLRALLIAALPVSLVFFQHEGPMPVYLVRDLGLSPSFYGLLFTVNTALIVALEVPLNHATARWSHARTLSLGAALFAAGFGAYGLGTRAAHIMIATVIWTFGEMILMPAMTAYVSEISPEDRRGEYMGLYMTGFSLAFTAGPWAGLYALERWGRPRCGACASRSERSPSRCSRGSRGRRGFPLELFLGLLEFLLVDHPGPRVLLVGLGEQVPARHVGDEVESARLGRVEHGLEGLQARRADRPRRQPAARVGVVGEGSCRSARVRPFFQTPSSRPSAYWTVGSACSGIFFSMRLR